MGRIGVLVVDDSVVVRRIVTEVLGEDADIDVLGTAPNGRIALSKLDQLAPDLVTLDIEMPEMNGLETLTHLRRTHPRLPVIMFSTLTERGGQATLAALAAGATDYVTKPANVGSVQESRRSVRDQLIPKIKALVPGRGASGLGTVRRLGPTTGTPSPNAAAVAPAGEPATAGGGAAAFGKVLTPTAPVELLVIGCSTGGPEALSQVLRALPASLPVPVVVVQHMPPVFTRLYADRLNTHCALTVREATDGEAVVPGTVLIAPGDFHVELARDGRQVLRTRLQQGPPENYCRPAVDVLFRSAAAVVGRGVLAAVLTGMGQDGKRGAEDIRGRGGSVLAQDEATSVVWGMPGAVATAGLAQAVLPLTEIAPALLRAITTPTAGGRVLTTPGLATAGPVFPPREQGREVAAR
ncbi:MAG: protein-glutamate methylesterase/protein-glutamine glutaminase [Actinomycetales bacterium]